MRYVFYDFETSGTDLLDQILSFAFVETTPKYKIEDSLTGTIKPNKTQWPHPQAIFTNKLNIEILQTTGIHEWEAAASIHSFLQKCINTHQRIILIGYNSARFDWEFLKSLFIRYGLSPYFMGKIIHIDLLYMVRQCYFQHSDTFPLPHSTATTGHTYRSMTLETVAKTLHILSEKQQHDALADVQICINLAHELEKRWQISPQNSRYHTLSQCKMWQIYRQKIAHFSENPEELKPFIWKYWIPLAQEKNGGLALDLQRWITQDYTAPEKAIKYTNQTRHEMCLEAVNEADVPEIYQAAYTQALSTPELLTLTMADHFATPPDWDIAYQLHALGFKRIETLRYYILQLIKNPDSNVSSVSKLWAERKEPKDVHLIQLLNRAYLEIHPNPKQAHLMKYIQARYIAGHMYRNPEDKPNMRENIAWVENELKRCNTETEAFLNPLLAYYQDFMCKFEGL
jgi:DNA polymerase III epsilon subunit-like protein